MLGIPVDSEQALSLAGNWAVRLLISSMYLQQNARDQLARAEMAYLYQRGNQKGTIDFNTLFRESGEVKSGLLEKYLPREIVRRWNDLAHHNIYEWVSQVIPLLVESDQADPFISRFLEICLLQNNRGRTTIRDFLNWWEENKEGQMVIFPSHQEAVRVMTIHKAKGLESPIVLLPWADFELKPRKDTLFWTDQLPDRYAKYKLLPLSFSSELTDSRFADAYRQELLEGLTEGLNTVYVAFTRARQRLYVGSYQPSGSLNADDLTHLYKLLWSLCTGPEWNEYWNPDNNSLMVGDLDEPLLRKEQDSAPALPIDRIRLGSYQKKIPLGPGDQSMFTLTDHYKAQHIREGIQVHTALERLQHSKELPKVLQQMQSEAIITSTDGVNIQHKIEELFRQPVFSSFFDPEWKVYSEREITSNGKLFKPDRVMINGEKAIVVDYKREKENPKHHKQVGDYGALMEQMGFSEVRKYLVYVSELRVVAV
jgi:ATP-dependent exoDNAse (exonuclease V) beta subunit